MKKILILALLFVPVMSFGAPAVRMLGGSTKTSSTAAVPGTVSSKVTPARVASTTTATTGRIGAVRAKTNVTATTGAITGSSSRFPVIAPAKSYGGISTPGTGSGTGTVTPAANVDTDAIVAAVTQNLNSYITNNYYNKTDFTQAVREVNKDDPRIDAVRRSNPVSAHPNEELDDDFVYIWVETGD